MTVGLAKEPNHIVGHDFAGIVEEIGEEVRHNTRKVGERVAGSVHGGNIMS
jgi:NADPH:quinone reductase-like Zn-dependent oxidoreductase